MPYSETFLATEPSRREIDAMEGPAVLEFGAPWCGYCRAAQPLIAGALSKHPQVQHLKIEDGKGRQLGRSFGVKLWPTLIFLRNGKELARAIRPADPDELGRQLNRITATDE